MMDSFLMLGFGVFVILLLVVFGGLAIWLSVKSEDRKRELAHAERIRAIECGYTLPDAAVARNRAVGWIGAGVPAVSLAIAAWVTWVVLGPGTSSGSHWVLALVWSVCGVTASVCGLGALLLMRSGDGETAAVRRRAPEVTGEQAEPPVAASTPVARQESVLAGRPGQ
jgi:hypothetical protein